MSKKIYNFYDFINERLVGVEPIANYDIYNKNMSLSYVDKLFFLDKVDTDVIVDFGCANGHILGIIKQQRPDISVIGYDLDENMLSIARKKIGDDSVLTTDWETVTEELKKYKSPLLLLSSVIHEVYSYSHAKVVKKFWDNQVFSNNFKWVAIRDMMPSTNELRFKDIHEDVAKVRQRSNSNLLDSFESKWGSIDDYRSFIHYLLKYKYVENWEREVNENYIPLTVETFQKKIPSNWSIKYEDKFTVPFITQQIYNDFGVNLRINTHAKYILKNNSF